MNDEYKKPNQPTIKQIDAETPVNSIIIVPVEKEEVIEEEKPNT